MKTSLFKLALTLAVMTTGQIAWACQLPPVSGYKRVECLKDGLSKVRKDDKFGAVNQAGQVVIPVRYDNVNLVGEGMATVVQNKKMGLIHQTGKMILPVQYDYIAPFSEGLAGVSKGGKFGFVDSKGTFVVPLRYDGAHPSFKNGKVSVSLGGEWFNIDKQGNRIK